MIILKATELFYGTGIDTARFGEDNISFVSSDSEKVSPGSVFVCIRGTKVDGHTFISDAIRKGARLIITENGREFQNLSEISGVPVICTADTRSTLSHLWNNFCGRPSDKLKIFAVTGTNGKTTVTNMLSSIYTLRGDKTETIGTLTGKLTTPDPSELYPRLRDAIAKGVTHIFMEASSHALALGKLDPLKPDYGIFTNLTPEHLDFHKTMKDYFNAKAKLFCMCRRGVINLDDSYANELIRSSSCDVITYSVNEHDSDFHALGARLLGANGIMYNMRTADRIMKIRSSVPGGFTVYNTLAAASCAYSDGVHPDIIRDALSTFRGVKGRLERVPLHHNEYSVYIDFAHTPDALDNILRTVRSFIPESSRLVVLFGCGGDRDKTKRPVMGKTASKLADYVIVTSDNSRTENPDEIIEQIMSGFDKTTPHIVIPDRREAIFYAVSNAKPGDCILLAGKGHEEYELNADGYHPFSEKELVIAASAKTMY